MEYCFTIPGQPSPWQVYTRRGKPSLGFEKMRAWQAQIQAHVRSQMDKEPLFRGPVLLTMDFYLVWPDTAPQRQPDAIARWRREHLAKKPDLTNLVKAAEDAIAPLLFAVGDQQVVSITAAKHFANPETMPGPQTLIVVEVLE